MSSDIVGMEQRATFLVDPRALTLPDAIRRASLHVGISWFLMFSLAAPAALAAGGVAYILFEPVGPGVAAFALASVLVAVGAAWKCHRDVRRKTFLVDLPVSIVAGAVASFITLEILVASLNPLERNLLTTHQLFFWFASIPGGFTVAAQVLLLASATRWGLAKPPFRWPLLAGLAGAVGMPIVAYSWVYVSRGTALWPLGLILVLVAAASDFMIYYRLQPSPVTGIGSG